MKKIKLYSLPTCVSCAILKEKLQEQKIKYELVDDMDSLRRANILNVPQLEVTIEEEIIVGLDPLVTTKRMNFNEAIIWIRGMN